MKSLIIMGAGVFYLDDSNGHAVYDIRAKKYASDADIRFLDKYGIKIPLELKTADDFAEYGQQVYEFLKQRLTPPSEEKKKLIDILSEIHAYVVTRTEKNEVSDDFTLDFITSLLSFYGFQPTNVLNMGTSWLELFNWLQTHNPEE